MLEKLFPYQVLSAGTLNPCIHTRSLVLEFAMDARAVAILTPDSQDEALSLVIHLANPSFVRFQTSLGWWIHGYLEKGIQTPMAPGRSTKITLMIELLRTSKLSIKNSLPSGTWMKKVGVPVSGLE